MHICKDGLNGYCIEKKQNNGISLRDMLLTETLEFSPCSFASLTWEADSGEWTHHEISSFSVEKTNRRLLFKNFIANIIRYIQRGQLESFFLHRYAIFA